MACWCHSWHFLWSHWVWVSWVGALAPWPHALGVSNFGKNTVFHETSATLPKNTCFFEAACCMAMHTRGDDNSTVRQDPAKTPVVLDANMGHQGGHSPAIFKKRKVRKKASEVQTATMPQGSIGTRVQGQKARSTLPMSASGAFPTWPHALGVPNFGNTGPGGRMASKDPPRVWACVTQKCQRHHQGTRKSACTSGQDPGGCTWSLQHGPPRV